MSAYNPISSPDAEKYILGSLLQPLKISFEQTLKIRDLPTDVFTPEVYRIIHQAILTMKPGDHDPFIVGKHFEKLGQDMAKELLSLVAAVPSTVDLDEHIKIVKECYIRRMILQYAEAACRDSTNGLLDVNNIREGVIANMRDIPTLGRGKSVTGREDAEKTVANLKEIINTPYEQRIHTGVTSMDKMFGGIFGSKVLVIGALTGVGKSALALQIAHKAVINNRKVLYCSFEMGANELNYRLASRITLIPSERISRGELSEKELEKVNNAIRDNVSKYAFYKYTASANVSDIRAEAVRLIKERGLDLIVVDYVTQVIPKGTRENKNNQVSDITRDLKLLSLEIGTPIIEVAQLNRESARENRKPRPSDLRDSGAIEADADIIVLLYAIDENGKMKSDAERLKKAGMQLIGAVVPKNRGGKPFETYLAFCGDTMSFASLYPDNVQPPVTTRESYSHYTD